MKEKNKHKLEFKKNIMIFDQYIVDLEKVSVLIKRKDYFIIVLDGISREINIDDDETYVLIKEKYIDIKTNTAEIY